MKWTVIDPPLPSFARWKALFSKHPNVSSLRAMEYDQLSRTPIEGRVLDVGGGKNALYQKHLPKGIDYVSVNIDPNIEPTHILAPGEAFPLDDDQFDALAAAVIAKACTSGLVDPIPAELREAARREGWIACPAHDALTRMVRSTRDQTKSG